MTNPIWRYMNVQQAYGPSFCSDGKHFTFIANITDVPQVWRGALPGVDRQPRWPEQMTFGSERVQGAVASSVVGDDRIVFARDSGGNENAQLFLLDPSSGTETLLTEGHEDAMHIPGEWSADGKLIIFGANRRDKALFDLYIHDLESGEDKLIWENNTPGFPFQAKFNPAGTRVVVNRLHSNFDTAVFEVDVESGGVRMVSPETESVYYNAPTYIEGGKALLILTDLDSDFQYLARMDPTTGEISRLHAQDWDIDGLTLSNDGKTAVFATNDEGSSTLYCYDVETGEVKPGPLADVFGVLTTPQFSFSPDDSMVLFAYTSATRTSDVYVWHLDSDECYPVTQASHGGLAMDSFASPELIRYPTFDQDETGQTRTVPAWMFTPKDAEGDLPVVVVVHGGPEGQSRPIFNFLIQYLVEAGYAVFVPNVRGSVGYGKAYSHLDDVEKRMDSVADLAHGVYWLKERPGIDPNRIVVYGGSYGGFMVLAAVTHYPDLWAAGVDIVGISNLATFLENTSAYRRPAREAEYGTLADDREFLEEIAPINHIDQVKVPLMVIHGRNDPRVPLSEAEQMVAALKERNIPVEFLVFDDEGHGVIKRKNKLVMYPAVKAFLDQYV